MPELPEVESFRQLLLPLVSSDEPIVLERLNLDKTPPKVFPSDDEIDGVSGKYRVSDVLRKGKLICIVLEKCENSKKTATSKSSKSIKGETTSKKQRPKEDEVNCAVRYLFLHMGMTGRISTPDHVPDLESLTSSQEYPPAYAYLRLKKCGENPTIEACFSDPRKFGSVQLKTASSLEEAGFGDLAVDALSLKDNQEEADSAVEKLSEKSMGIKAMLLDQKRIVSGVGNWVADEVLFQVQMHPDQTYLTKEQAQDLVTTLSTILSTAVECLHRHEDYPTEWLFHYRWDKRKMKRGKSKDGDAASSTLSDSQGRALDFVTSGGRTSAIVPAIQHKKSQGPTDKKKQISPSTEKKSKLKPEPATSDESHPKASKVQEKRQSETPVTKTSKISRKRTASQQGRNTTQVASKKTKSVPDLKKSQKEQGGTEPRRRQGRKLSEQIKPVIPKSSNEVPRPDPDDGNTNEVRRRSSRAKR
jgi:formamidopyrimidine-DNA glycosylase